MRFEAAQVEGMPGAVILIDQADGTELEIRLTGHQIQTMLELVDRAADEIRRVQNEKWG